MLNINSPISFKAKFEIDLNKRENVSPQEVAEDFDKHIGEIQRAKSKTSEPAKFLELVDADSLLSDYKKVSLDIIEYMQSPEVKNKLERMPEKDTVCFAPLADPDEPDDKGLYLYYIPSDEGRKLEDTYELVQEAGGITLTGNMAENYKQIDKWINHITFLLKSK